MTKGNEPATKRKRLLLTPRDLNILRLAADHGIVTSDEILKLFSTSKCANAHLRRIRKLCSAGYLAPMVGDGMVRLGYRLERKGREYLGLNGQEPRKTRPLQRRYRGTFDHDRMLHHIESILYKSPLVSGYVTDAELRSEMAKQYGANEARKKFMFVPDGLFSLKTVQGTFKVALELELSVKSKERYRKKLTHLLTTHQISAVLFLVRDKTIEHCIKANLQYIKDNDWAVKGSSRINALYFADARKFLESGHDAPFFGDDGNFSLRSLEEAIAKKPQNAANLD